MKEKFEQFKRENGRYPTAVDIDKCDYLPSSRTIQRNYGGVVALRKKLGLKDTDYTKGKLRSAVADECNKRAAEKEISVYRFLKKYFGSVRVHREHPLTDEGRSRCDFYLFKENGETFIIDVFYAKDRGTFSGCLNIKSRKYKGYPSGTLGKSKIIFVQTNPNMPEQEIQKLVNNKKNPLDKRIFVMGISEFKKSIV